LGTRIVGHPVIEARQLSKVYRDTGNRTTVALAGIDASFDEGQITLLVGPSGCGKTTLLNIVAGFEAADSGTVLEDGKPTRGPNPRRGVIFQDPNLFPWLTVWQNLMFGPDVRGEAKAVAAERAESLLEMVGLLRFKDHLPHQLSGGMRHRLHQCRSR
jgi:NitT/TauT family transport system ATP-binding protein